MNDCFVFDIFNIPVRIDVSKTVSDDFLDEFRFFKPTESFQSPYLQVTVIIDATVPLKRGLCLYKNSLFSVHINSWKRKSFNYFKDGQLIASAKEIVHKEQMQFILNVADEATASEILYYYIHSVIGEKLELTGYTRLHAALIKNKMKYFLLWGPSGAGKSHLCYEAYTQQAEILSEEITLLDLKQKTFVGFPSDIYLLERKNDAVLRIDASVFFKSKYRFKIPNPTSFISTKRINLIHLKKTSSWMFYFSLFWGLGLPQMAMYLIRPSTLYNLIKIFSNRIVLLAYFLKLSYQVGEKELTSKIRFEKIMTNSNF